jgi:hypothetical protein
MFLNIDLLTISEAAFQLLGEHRRGSEATDQLLTAFGAAIDAALID